MSTVDANVSELSGRTAGDVITVRGKELAADATVAAGRALFASGSVQLIPLLDGDAYVGAVTRDDLAGADDAERISAHAGGRPPNTTASTPLGDALAVLNDDGGRRLVVLGDDRKTYVGLICLHRDRVRLCIDAECHAAGGASR
jgi:predicted transcriptional regulator